MSYVSDGAMERWNDGALPCLRVSVSLWFLVLSFLVLRLCVEMVFSSLYLVIIQNGM